MIDFRKHYYCLNHHCGIWSSPKTCFFGWLKDTSKKSPFDWFDCWQWIDPSHQLPLKNYQLKFDF